MTHTYSLWVRSLSGHKLHEISPSMYQCSITSLVAAKHPLATSMHRLCLLIRQRFSNYEDLALNSVLTRSCSDFYWEIWGAQTTLAQSSCISPGLVHPSQVSQDLYLSRIICDHSWVEVISMISGQVVTWTCFGALTHCLWALEVCTIRGIGPQISRRAPRRPWSLHSCCNIWMLMA